MIISPGVWNGLTKCTFFIIFSKLTKHHQLEGRQLNIHAVNLTQDVARKTTLPDSADTLMMPLSYWFRCRGGYGALEYIQAPPDVLLLLR